VLCDIQQLTENWYNTSYDI